MGASFQPSASRTAILFAAWSHRSIGGLLSFVRSGGLIESLSVQGGSDNSPPSRPASRSKLFASFHCFRAARIAVNYLLPAFAVVKISCFPGIEGEGDPLTVVTIEAVEIQEVAAQRRTSGIHLLFIQSA